MLTFPQRLCLAALAKHSLMRKGRAWSTGRRGFSNHTISALIQRGLARRFGDRVVGLLAANDNGPIA
jgi:hypothetical protein